MTYVREDPNAITIPLIADAPAYADRPTGMTNLQWCERELARIHAKDNRQPRLVRVGRRCWITRAKNAPRQPRRNSGVGLDTVVGLLPVGLIPIPPMIIQEANRRAMENGDLTFGHGFALGLALCAAWGLCAAAIWIKRAIVRRFRKANIVGR